MWQHSHAFRSFSFCSRFTIVICPRSLISLIVGSVSLLCSTCTPATPLGSSLLPSCSGFILLLFFFLYSSTALSSINKSFVYFGFLCFCFAFFWWTVLATLFIFIIWWYWRATQNSWNSKWSTKRNQPIITSSSINFLNVVAETLFLKFTSLKQILPRETIYCRQKCVPLCVTRLQVWKTELLQQRAFHFRGHRIKWPVVSIYWTNFQLIWVG